MLKREKGQQMGIESLLPLCGMNQTLLWPGHLFLIACVPTQGSPAKVGIKPTSKPIFDGEREVIQVLVTQRPGPGETHNKSSRGSSPAQEGSKLGGEISHNSGPALQLLGASVSSPVNEG